MADYPDYQTGDPSQYTAPNDTPPADYTTGAPGQYTAPSVATVPDAAQQQQDSASFIASLAPYVSDGMSVMDPSIVNNTPMKSLLVTDPKTATSTDPNSLWGKFQNKDWAAAFGKIVDDPKAMTELMKIGFGAVSGMASASQAKEAILLKDQLVQNAQNRNAAAVTSLRPVAPWQAKPLTRINGSQVFTPQGLINQGVK